MKTMRARRTMGTPTDSPTAALNQPTVPKRNNKPRNFFDVQIVYAGGARWRETTRKDVTVSRIDIADGLEKMAKRIRETEARINAKSARPIPGATP